MSNYVERCIELCKQKNPGEVEFHQTVEDVYKRQVVDMFNLLLLLFGSYSYTHIKVPTLSLIHIFHDLGECDNIIVDHIIVQLSPCTSHNNDRSKQINDHTYHCLLYTSVVQITDHNYYGIRQRVFIEAVQQICIISPSVAEILHGCFFAFVISILYALFFFDLHDDVIGLFLRHVILEIDLNGVVILLRCV